MLEFQRRHFFFRHARPGLEDIERLGYIVCIELIHARSFGIGPRYLVKKAL